MALIASAAVSSVATAVIVALFGHDLRMFSAIRRSRPAAASLPARQASASPVVYSGARARVWSDHWSGIGSLQILGRVGVCAPDAIPPDGDHAAWPDALNGAGWAFLAAVLSRQIV
jgi:hypothetical protein